VISPDEARDLAAVFHGIAGDDIKIREFDLGYLAWIAEPPPEDPTRVPSTVGGTVLVVDKQTGETTTWPNLGPTAVIDMYRTSKKWDLNDGEDS
jgi:hypothetical protein